MLGDSPHLRGLFFCPLPDYDYVVGLDGRQSTMAGVHRGCGLPMERHCRERG